jgi:hypothetical protein
VGWGTADEQEQEPAPPAPGVVDALHGLFTPDGLPAAPVWWVGQLYGTDVLLDRAALVSTVPVAVTFQGRRVAAGGSTYHITEPGLVAAAAEELQPPFARAARLAWHAAARAPAAARLALERCCVTWVAAGRPGEALSHVLKLAASDPASIRVAWETLAVTLLALGRLPAEALEAMEAPAALRRALPEFLDWADSAAGDEAQIPFLAAWRSRLDQAARAGDDDLPALLADTRRLWAETALTSPGLRAADVFAPPRDEGGPARPKKRRY